MSHEDSKPELPASAALPVMVIETDRLRVRHLALEDAAFVLTLLNEPSWLRFIGDKGVRNLEDARNYLLSGPLAMYARHGHGLYLVERKSDAAAMGMCGLIKRDTLPDVDIGFAFLPVFWGQGYAYEAACAVLAHGRAAFGLARVVAITTPDNHASARLLEKLGLRFEEMLTLPGSSEPLRLFATIH